DEVAIHVVEGVPAPQISVPATWLVARSGSSLPIDGWSLSSGDLQSHNFQLQLQVQNGMLNVDTSVSGGVAAGQVSGNGTGAVTITAPLGALNAILSAAGGLVYQSQNGYLGSDNLLAMLTDPGVVAGDSRYTVVDVEL